jgi:octanoyl-[GcvH]:protein N-octanoyltransferase
MRDSFPEDPAFDTGVSRALMLRVVAGELPDTLRIARPGRLVAFGRRDVVAAEYQAAVAAAHESGFQPVQGLAGGRAAAFHEGTIAFAHAIADRDPRTGVTERFGLVARTMAEAFAALGVDVRVGEVPGEYCPGAHSVNAGGERKLMGVGQRVVGGGVHVGGIIVVDGADLLREVLGPVYTALGLGFSRQAVGSIAGEVPGVGWSDVAAAVEDSFARRHTLEPAELDEGTLALARALAPEHLAGSVNVAP